MTGGKKPGFSAFCPLSQVFTNQKIVLYYLKTKTGIVLAESWKDRHQGIVFRALSDEGCGGAEAGLYRYL